MKSTSHAGIVLILIMLLLVLASLFWFLYSDYDAVREQADMANSRATRVSAMELEAGQLRAEADQVRATRSAVEGDLATAVFTQSTLEQELVNDQQIIQALEASLAEQVPDDTVPVITIISPNEGNTFNLTDAVELVVAATDPNGISAINIIFDNNPSLEIPAGGETSIIIKELWPLSEAGDHTAVVTAVNRNNVSSQATTVTISTENKRSSQQIIDAVANLIGPTTATGNEAQSLSATSAIESTVTPIILTAFDFAAPPEGEMLVWGEYCDATPSQSTPVDPQERPDLPAQELNLVKAQVREWQESRFQLSQLLAAAPTDDARAALCALSAGHERWVLEAYINGLPADEQALYTATLTPQTGLDTSHVLAAQRTFSTAYGPQFMKTLSDTYGTTAVTDVWSRPPSTTAHILFPGDYEANRQPPAIELPDLTTVLGDDWQAVTTDVLGAFMLGQYLGNQVVANGVETPALSVVETAVSGWQGDQFAIYQQDENGPVLLAMQLEWLTEQDALEFARVYEEVVNGRFAGTATEQESPENTSCWSATTAETICLYTNETKTILVRAPETDLAVVTLAEILEN